MVNFDIKNIIHRREILFKQFCMNKLIDDVYFNLISRGDESEYYNCNKLLRDVFRNDSKLRDECVSELRKMLEQNGWKTSVGFGGTGLFIYQHDKPHNCFDSGF